METVILIQLPVLIRRLKRGNRFLLFTCCFCSADMSGSRLMGTIIVKGWCMYLSDKAVHIFTLLKKS